MVVNGALNNILDVYIRDQSQTVNWYCGLVDNAGFSAFAAADTMASHAGWSESTAYTQANRVTWSPGAASAGSVSNSSVMTFSINATVTVHGIFIASSSTKGETASTLFGTAAFASGNQACNNGDTLQVTVTATITSS